MSSTRRSGSPPGSAVAGPRFGRASEDLDRGARCLSTRARHTASGVARCTLPSPLIRQDPLCAESGSHLSHKPNALRTSIGAPWPALGVQRWQRDPGPRRRFSWPLLAHPAGERRARVAWAQAQHQREADDPFVWRRGRARRSPWSALPLRRARRLWFSGHGAYVSRDVFRVPTRSRGGPWVSQGFGEDPEVSGPSSAAIIASAMNLLYCRAAIRG